MARKDCVIKSVPVYLSGLSLLALFIIAVSHVSVGWPILSVLMLIIVWGWWFKNISEATAPFSDTNNGSGFSDQPYPYFPATAADVIMAMDEPVLLVNDGQVEVANRAAENLLGMHIEGGDVRMAIRHPAAIRLLTEPLDNMSPVLLAGLGGLNRRWELYAYALNEEQRLILLRDQSTAHLTEQVRIDFVANTSHELRTPLATLSGFIETLEDDDVIKDRDTRHHFLGIMAREAKRMQNLVDDLMSLSRIEAGKFSLPNEIVVLSPLVAEIVSNIQASGQAKPSQITLKNQLSSDNIQGDRTEVTQLLYNIIGNALKYGRKDGQIMVNLENTDDHRIKLSIKDEGDGIPFHHIPRLTERFYRVDNSRSRALGGTGLGLAIVKQIVEHHRGELVIDSIAGKGTTVTVFLPTTDFFPD
ncbi:MAG: ATP-binding protein [Zymomonas mobilis]|uniref:histidine kinase n=1 Tax=Zymomonas mobilis TaxID=542 RepID=A0A542W1U8_ZYMMB|nr:ATP-binding protein [Zymomonas mobilis]TQL17538.1 two-component system phosphate regulon sensor histidine kinase PhoR [Zymomonas mobilis]